MSRSLPGRIARSATMFIAGLLAASALSASVAAAPATVSSTLTRVTSCQGLNFHPIDSDQEYGYDSSLMIHPRGDIHVGSGFFVCDPELPDRAVVTKVSFTVRDPEDHAEVRLCGLFRAGLTTSTVGTVQELAQVSSTGLAASPGVVRKTDSSIAHSTVDNGSWGYELQCQVHYTAGGRLPVGILGASITYRISSNG